MKSSVKWAPSIMPSTRTQVILATDELRVNRDEVSLLGHLLLT